jgi:hypothetical protein
MAAPLGVNQVTSSYKSSENPMSPSPVITTVSPWYSHGTYEVPCPPPGPLCLLKANLRSAMLGFFCVGLKCVHNKNNKAGVITSLS